MNSCPAGSYTNYNLKKCIKCDNACTKCFGPLITDCTECESSYYLLEATNTVK